MGLKNDNNAFLNEDTKLGWAWNWGVDLEGESGGSLKCIKLSKG